MTRVSVLVASGWIALIVGAAAAQAPEGAGRQGRAGAGARPTRPPLFFKEEWRQTPEGGEHAVVPEAVSNLNLEVKLYGPSGKEMLMSGSAQDESNPIHLWTGMCTTPCGATLRDRSNAVDLSGLARIRWVTKVSGLHQVRPLVKLADGTWLVGDHGDGSTADWHVSEFSLSEVRWLRLDIEKAVTRGTWIDKPDLTKVDEVGFVDLMPSSGHGQGGWSDVAAIEVFGKPVKR
jgi:hypothetical protein